MDFYYLHISLETQFAFFEKVPFMNEYSIRYCNTDLDKRIRCKTIESNKANILFGCDGI